MTKSIWLPTLILAAALPGLAAADSGPGCGVGTNIFKGQTGVSAHTVAATTNGSTWNQWFGITSGTLGCDDAHVVQNDFQRQQFVAANMDNLSHEMAQGSGAHLDSLASLLSIADEDRARFYRLTQRELPQLLESSTQGGAAVLATLDLALSNDPVLAHYAR